MAVKARDDVTLAAVTDIANVRRYYLLQGSALNPPAAPTVNPAPAPWVTSEPTYTEGSTNSLYTVDLTVFTDGTFDYSTVSKSSSYEAAKTAYNKAVSATSVANAALAAVPPFVQQETPSATVVGQLWFPLDAAGNVVGMKRAASTGTAGWVDYLMMASSILVPGSVGTVSLHDGAVTAPKIYATSELWAKMLNVAGDATIGGNLLAQSIAGKNILGAFIEGGEFLMRGSEGGSPSTGTLTKFTGTATDELKPWAHKSNLSIAGGGRSGNCLKSATKAFPDTNSPTGYSLGADARVLIAPFVGGDVSAWSLGSIPQTGITTVEAWVKPDRACQVNFGIFFENVGGDTVYVTQSFQLAANVYSRVSVTGPAGYRPRVPGTLSYYLLMTLEVPYFNTTSDQTLTVLFDDLTWTNVPDTASALHIYRDNGAPTLDLIDYQGITRARLSAPSSRNAGLSFFSNDGDAMTFTGGGLYGTKAGPGQTPTLLSSWEDIRANTRQEDVRNKISTVDGSNITSTVASALMLGQRIIFANIKIKLKARTTLSGWQIVQIGSVAAGYRPAELALFPIAWQPNIVLGVDVDGKVFLQSNTDGGTFNNGETYRIPANWVIA